MGNENSSSRSRVVASSGYTVSTSADDNFDLFTPPRKRAKLFHGSLSLRSIASLASSSIKSSDRNTTDTNGTSRKRKHADIEVPQSPSTSSTVLSIERHWPALMHVGFEPDFPWRSDITESDFVLLNSIGTGRFGNVYRAYPRKDPHQNVAIKVQNKVQVLRAGAEDQIRNEVKVQKGLAENRFVAKFIDVWQTQTELFTVMEYVDGYGDLFTLWSDYGQFSEELVKLYGVEIALGLQFLHENNIIHRDLKMENIALDIKLHIKFVDFGFAKYLEPKDRTQTICGTLQYMAPEVAKGRPYGCAVDWWSFGILLYIMRTGFYPFPNSNVSSHDELSYAAQEFPESCTTEFKEMIAKLLTIDPTRRLHRAPALFNEPFFADVNITGIFNKEVCPWEFLKNECKFRQVEPAQGGYSEHYSRVLSFLGFDQQVSDMDSQSS